MHSLQNDIRKLSHDEISVKRSTLETINDVRKVPVYCLLDSIRSNYNVGSIFRSSDGVMIEKLYLAGYTPHPPKKEILKTALGSTESVAWEYVQDPRELILDMKSRGIKICALEQTDKSIPYYNLTPEVFPVCMIVGNEVTGVSQNLIDLCDFSIEIPQFGIKQSLNVAVAYGIAVFEFRKIFDTFSA
ncbi:MAG: RNA methyltransferase [Syntrophothermus sp.]